MQEGIVKTGSWLDSPQFVAAAHELKTPLALIRQLSMELETGEYSSLERSILARRITLTSERALRLTTDLTRARRLEDSLFPLEAVDSHRVCREVIDELQPLYKAHNKQLVIKGRARQSLAVANRELLRRVVLNFADNALHYSDDNSSVAISISALGREQLVRIGVRDFGPALPPVAWRQIRQGLENPLPLHSRPGSSGLGMLIAHEFALAMGGVIGAIRHRDGATFYVEIPLSTQLRLL